MVMLCASAIESVRLLLNSRSSRHPEGIGNSTGLLGRYFLEQTPSLIAGSVPDSRVGNTIKQLSGIPSVVPQVELLFLASRT